MTILKFDTDDSYTIEFMAYGIDIDHRPQDLITTLGQGIRYR